MGDFSGGTAAGAGEEQKMIVFGVSYSTTKESFRSYFSQVPLLYHRLMALSHATGLPPAALLSTPLWFFMVDSPILSCSQSLAMRDANPRRHARVSA